MIDYIIGGCLPILRTQLLCHHQDAEDRTPSAHNQGGLPVAATPAPLHLESTLCQANTKNPKKASKCTRDEAISQDVGNALFLAPVECWVENSLFVFAPLLGQVAVVPKFAKKKQFPYSVGHTVHSLDIVDAIWPPPRDSLKAPHRSEGYV